MPENNYRDELMAFCKRLKIASAMADRAVTTEGETHIEFLYNLLKREIELRDQAHIDNIIKDAKFPVEYTFDQFRSDEVEFPDECSVDSLKSLEFLREHKNIIMYGGTGTDRISLNDITLWTGEPCNMKVYSPEDSARKRKAPFSMPAVTPPGADTEMEGAGEPDT